MRVRDRHVHSNVTGNVETGRGENRRVLSVARDLYRADMMTKSDVGLRERLFFFWPPDTRVPHWAHTVSAIITTENRVASVKKKKNSQEQHS